MVKFNTLLITSDCLVLDVQIENSEYYENVFLDSIIIDSDKTYKPFGPSSKPLYFKELEYSNLIYTSEDIKNNVLDEEDLKNILDEDYNLGYKRYTITLTPKDLCLDSFDENMFFIYVTVKGIPHPETPCGKDNRTVLQVAINLNPLFKKSLCFIQEMADNCKCYDKTKFIHFILQLKSLEYSVINNDIELAIKHWKLLTNKGNSNNNFNICCNEKF